ncbi:MAG TPA: tetratricopeptide repeat protein [Anaerolineales bacterium]|nr:tetratricopeptide repeat protein [Anaerolineales bacterium]
MEQSTQNALLDEAIGAARGGDRTKAKDKLTRYLRYDQKNEHAWLWMSAVVESDRERIFCLNNVLKLNPNNKMAKRGLALLGALPADMRADLDIEIIGVDLKADVTTAGAAGKRQKRGGFTFRRNRRLENVAIAGLAVPIVGGCIVFGLNLGGSQVVVAGLLGIESPTPRPTATPVPPTLTPTNTPIPPTATEVAIATPIIGANQTPIAELLGVSYTAAPPSVEVPFFPEEAYNTGERAYLAGEYDAALLSFRDAVEQNANNYAAHYYTGAIYLEKKDYNRAFLSYSAALKINSGFAPALLGRGQANFRSGGNPLSDYQKAKDAAREWAEPYIQTAIYYADRKQPDKAIAELETARGLDSNNVNVYWNLAEQYLAVGRVDEALAVLQTGLELDATALDLYRVQAKILLAVEDFQTALEKINLYISYRPTDAEGWTIQGRAYLGLDDAANAFAALTRAVELKPFDPRDALVARGTANLILGQPEAARADFDRALQLGITTRNRLLIGHAYYDVGDYVTAVKEFEKAVASDTTGFETNYWLGRSLVSNEQYDKGIEAINDALGRADTDLRRFDCFYQRALAYDGLDERDSAVQDLRDALVLNVTDRETEQADATLILSRLGGPEVNATYTPTAQP